MGISLLVRGSRSSVIILTASPRFISLALYNSSPCSVHSRLYTRHRWWAAANEDVTSSPPLSDVIGDVMAAVRDVTALTSSLALSDSPVRPSDVEIRPAASLDDLPVEILMEIASSLDYRSLLSLERLSERCRHAVALHLGQVKVFNIKENMITEDEADEDEEDEVAITKDGVDPNWKKLSHAQKERLLSRLTGLRELRVDVINRIRGRTAYSCSQWLHTAAAGVVGDRLNWLATAGRSWR